MRVLTIGQHKGGVGKTMLTRLIALAAARAGHRVLAIDLDGQANLSQRFLQMRRDPTSEEAFYPPVHPEFEEIIADDPEYDGVTSSADVYYSKPIYPYPTAIDNLHILPAHALMLSHIDKVDDPAKLSRIYLRMNELMADPDLQSLYDLVIIDTPPSLVTPLPESAMVASTHLLIPAQLEQGCVEGLQTMLARWMKANALRGNGDRIELIGIAVNMFQKSTALHTSYLQEMMNDANLGPFIIPHIIKRGISFADADHEAFRPKSVLDLKPSHPARQDAEALVAYVLNAMGLSPEPVREEKAQSNAAEAA